MSQEDLESQATGDQEGEEEGRRVLVSSVAEISLTEAHVYLQLSSAPSGHIFTIYQVTRSQGLYCLLRKEERRRWSIKCLNVRQYVTKSQD